jgi:DNA-binding transcriptional LysR family regulator
LHSDVITAEKLLDMPLIMFTDRNDITNMLMKNLAKLGYDNTCLNRNLRVESIESAKMLVSKRYGLCFLPYIAIKEELYKKQFKVIKLSEFNMDLEITMFYKRIAPSMCRILCHGSRATVPRVLLMPTAL